MIRSFGIAATWMAMLAFVGAVALAQAQRQDQPGQPQRPGQQPGQAQQQPGQRQAQLGDISSWEQDYLKYEASAAQFEIQLGQLAQQRIQDQQVKQFAQKLVQDHQQAQQQLQQTARQMNIDLPRELNPVHQAMLQAMQNKQGAQFQWSYLFHQIGMHHKAVLQNQFMAKNAQSQQVKQYASQTVPTLRQHLAQAEQIVGTEVRTAGQEITPGQQQNQQQQQQQDQLRRDQQQQDRQQPGQPRPGTPGGQTGDRPR